MLISQTSERDCSKSGVEKDLNQQLNKEYHKSTTLHNLVQQLIDINVENKVSRN